MVKNPPANAIDRRDVGLIPGSGRSPGEGNANPVGGRGPRSVVWRQHVELWEEFPPSDAGAEMPWPLLCPELAHGPAGSLSP